MSDIVIPEQFERTVMVLGKDGLKRLMDSRVCVFGCGGVGGYVIEVLARSGVGHIDIVDGDIVDITNVNRQIIALHSTLGMKKTQAVAERIRDINPLALVTRHDHFYNRESADRFVFSDYDYVVDAIDSVRDKLDIIERCVGAGVKIISSMGAGRKLDPMRFRVADIYSTSVCPLARVMRRELKKRGIGALKVVFSDEPVTPGVSAESESNTDHSGYQGMQRKLPVGSVPWIPAAAGLLIGREVISDLTG